MRIVIDATAAISGGKVYLEQLLPHLARIADGHEFIIFHTGEFDELALPPSRAKFEFRHVALRFSGIWIGAAIEKLLWRLAALPVHLWRLKPDLLFSNAGFAPRWKPGSVKTVLALHNSMPPRLARARCLRWPPMRQSISIRTTLAEWRKSWIGWCGMNRCAMIYVNERLGARRRFRGEKRRVRRWRSSSGWPVWTHRQKRDSLFIFHFHF